MKTPMSSRCPLRPLWRWPYVIAPLGAQQAGEGQAPSTAGMVLKGKAPVSNDVLKVKLPKPQEADLPNGLHLMVLEDHRLPQIAFQIVIPGAGGYYDDPAKGRPRELHRAADAGRHRDQRTRSRFRRSSSAWPPS